MMKKILKIFLIILCIGIISAFIAGYKYQSEKANEKQEEVTLTFKELTLETGSLVPTVSDFLENGEVKESATINFEKIDLKDNESKELKTIFIYKDDKGNLVSEEVAFELDSDILKENYTKEEIIIGVGKYKTIIENNTKTYETTLIIEDKESPTLEVQDVSITEGTKIDISNFIKTCSDNSYIDCSYILIDNDFKEIDLPTKTGKYNFKIVATDGSNNKTEKEVTLSIEEKKKNTTTNSTSSNKNTKKDSTSNKSNNSSEQSNNNTNTSQNNQVDGPWTKYGLTEDQYYNKPMYSYEHIDYSVNDYGTEEACINACRQYGLSYEPYLKGEVSFGCRSINSMSGKYLGEMFYTRKLK